jgi:hypothetical protein
MLIVVVPLAAVAAMAARAAMAWGPMNLVVLVGFVLIASAILACVPSIPHRPFWAGLAGFGFLYGALLWLMTAISGIGLGPEPIYRGLAERHYGPAPDFHTASYEEWSVAPIRERSIAWYIAAAHALSALLFGVFGGCALLYLAKVRESRQWDRDALPERPLEDFLLPPLKIDRPLNSK